MADILTQILISIENRLTSIEHRLGHIEKSKDKSGSSQYINWEKHKPRIVWGLTATGLATLQVLFPQAMQTASLLLSKLPL